MKTPADFWDNHAEGYAKRPIGDVPAYEQTLEHVRMYLNGDDKVIELGCGTGTTALKLADSVAEIVGTDVSAEMVRIAAGKDGPNNVRFVQSDASGADLQEGGFDAVLAFNLIHLLEDIPVAAENAAKLLKPGGLFISKTPCLGEKLKFQLLRPIVMGLRLIGKAPFVHFMKYRDLERAITGAGFEIVDTALYPEASASRFIVAKLK